MISRNDYLQKLIDRMNNGMVSYPPLKEVGASKDRFVSIYIKKFDY